MRIIRCVTLACGIALLGVHADDAPKPPVAYAEAGPEKTGNAVVSEEETSETTEAASSEGEAAATPATTTAAPAAVDLFNLPRRVRSQISYTVKRMLEFDKNSDGLLGQDELPQRMQGVIAKGDLDGDSLLSKDELTRMAYDQIQKREAKAEAEPEPFEKR